MARTSLFAVRLESLDILDGVVDDYVSFVGLKLSMQRGGCRFLIRYEGYSRNVIEGYSSFVDQFFSYTRSFLSCTILVLQAPVGYEGNP